MRALLLALALLAPLVVRAVDERSKLPTGYKLLYQQNFETPAAAADFVMTDPNAWEISKDEKGSALELKKQSKYEPKYRSPFNIAVIKEKLFGDFIMEGDFIQTGREYGHRDMIIAFGMQSPTQFYYTHVATAADDHAHNVFIVNNAPRTKIAKETTKGVDWGLGVWHKIKVERTLADGLIKVYFDDMSKPIMVAEDKTFGKGYIGVGSFDDTGKIDNVKIWGPSVDTKSTAFFSSPK